jgi:PHD/YefM family antitoxin component YafN of YafNO toxin-antitoxin module
MTNTLQYICDSEGQTVSVVVPIAIWQEIMAERETAYLLSSPAMKARLLTAKKRQDEISLEAACEKLGI